MPTPAGATPGAEVWEGVVIFTVFIGAFSLQSTWPKCSVDQTLGWNPRPGAGSGLVTGSILIPMVLVANNLHGNAKEYGVSGMFCAYSLCMSHAAVCLVWLSIGNFAIGIVGVVFCLCVLHGLLTSLPSSLSLGEAMIASEGVALLMIDSCQNVFYRIRSLEYELLQISLIGYWSVMTLVAIATVARQNRTNPAGAGSTIVRKYFHLIAIAVFLPGLMRNPQLLYIGSVAALGAFILLEYLRMYRIQPFGESLHTSLRVFVDEKDRGVAILTHIYLLLGCSLPLWLYPSAYTIGTKKTVEGTLAAMVAQLTACCTLSLLGIQPSFTANLIPIVTAVCLTSLLEAFTSQVDNIVTPLYMYALFSSGLSS
uniref:dolichol kinase n=1 Tax=Branchiostoma floridae TaxID=7739 RepID=C3ZKS4_BRAFL|eukprot:XP_002590814.1 hypothetical protein BRAFLDRAFT_90053 [Branchiostoma floridae]